MDSARIHLADVPPPYCSSCWNALPQDRFVDFGAEHEGPVFAHGHPDSEVAGGGITTTDAIVICESCVRAAAEQVGMGDVEQLREQLAALAADREQMSDRLGAQAAHIDQLEKAIATRADLSAAMRPPAAADQEGLELLGMPELRELGDKLGLKFKPGTSKDQARRLIRDARITGKAAA